ncbi:helix-turn-helix transcriptional regulator [Citromicrobium phage vB_CbaS-RXM]|nr:helix-turn-helix transcriptional regulator [Citromicrobium phage vB_CbaS-RXM]
MRLETGKLDADYTIPMILFCPNGHRHIDEGEFANRPHRVHACQECGITWQPAKVNTHGVQFLPGYKNEEPA